MAWEPGSAISRISRLSDLCCLFCVASVGWKDRQAFSKVNGASKPNKNDTGPASITGIHFPTIYRLSRWFKPLSNGFWLVGIRHFDAESYRSRPVDAEFLPNGDS